MKSIKKPGNLKIFAWASFLNDCGSDMIAPIWPVFITKILGANMAALGLIDGLGEALVSISQAFSGYYSDRLGKRKIFVWLGYSFGSLAKLGYGFSSFWGQIIPLRILDRAGKMRGAPRDAMITDISTKENRGGYFGFLRAMDNLGALAGILLCMFLSKLVGYRTLFILAALPPALAAFLVLRGIRDPGPGAAKIFKGLQLNLLDANFKLFLLLSSIFALGSFSYSFLMIYGRELGISESWLPLLYLVFTAMASLVSIPFGRLSDKTGRKFVVMLSYALWILVCLVFIFLRHPIFVWIGFALYGTQKGALEAVQKALVAELSPENLRASLLGGFQMVVGLCALPASWISGFLWEKVSPLAPFSFSLGLSLISIALLNWVREK